MLSSLKKTILWSLLVFTVLLMVFLVKTYQLKNKPHLLSLQESIRTHRRKPPTVNDLTYLSSWMTFDYINKLFNLPETYLEQSLQVNDPKYPFLTVEQYAKKTNINTVVVIENIQKYVRRYITSSPLLVP
jgi:hypothetical protein